MTVRLPPGVAISAMDSGRKRSMTLALPEVGGAGWGVEAGVEAGVERCDMAGR